MRKSTEFESAILDVIKTRKSRKAYSDRPVEDEKINSLFEAARWAPSSYNEQPWGYLYATKANFQIWNGIASTLYYSNRIWARNAQLLIMSFVRNHFLHNGQQNSSARYDLGAANAFLSLEAEHLGLNVHQIGGFDLNKARSALNIPCNWDPVVVLAIGYPGEIDALPDNLKSRELDFRERYLCNEFARDQFFQGPI